MKSISGGSPVHERPEQTPALRRLPTLTVAIIVVALIALTAAAIETPVATGDNHNPVERAKLSQAGRSLIIQVRTAKQVALRKLNRTPDFRNGRSRYLCLEIGRSGRGVISRICLGGKNKPHHRVGVSRTNAAGKVYSSRTIAAHVKRHGKFKLVVKLEPGKARLVPDSYRWQVSLADGSCGSDPSACRATYPAARRLAYRLLRVQAVGCTGGNGQVVRHGPRRGKRVAFTFDDGPGPDTDAVLATLKRFRVKATFFMLGSQVAANPAVARKALAGDHELANHSFSHSLLPGYSDVARASRTIRSVTGFRPCLFRPPYGAMNSALKSSVKRAKMKSVIWDVDTNDWKRPGSGAIRGAITRNVRPGSIVLMHDAGGPRGQTVAALPGAIRTLKRRGYQFVTVSELLGNRIRYRPVK